MSWEVSGGRGNNFKTEMEELVRFFASLQKKQKQLKWWGILNQGTKCSEKVKKTLLIKARPFAKGCAALLPQPFEAVML